MRICVASVFPFRLTPIPAAHLVAVSGRLDVLRHGLDQDLIMLPPEDRLTRASRWQLQAPWLAADPGNRSQEAPAELPNGPALL